MFFTRSRPYKKEDWATIASKNNHVVRHYGCYHRNDTPTELKLLNRLGPLVCDWLNFFIRETRRLHHRPGRPPLTRLRPALDPYQRLLNAGVPRPNPGTRSRHSQGHPQARGRGRRDQPRSMFHLCRLGCASKRPSQGHCRAGNALRSVEGRLPKARTERGGHGQNPCLSDELCPDLEFRLSTKAEHGDLW